MINDRKEGAGRDAHDTARREVDGAEQRIAEIQTELTAYRVKQKMLDPKSASAGVLELIGQMNAAQANARAQLGELLKNSPNSPQIPLIKTRIASLDTLIGEERAKLSGETNSVVTTLTEDERLILERELGDIELASAYTSLQSSRLESQRNICYIQP